MSSTFISYRMNLLDLLSPTKTNAVRGVCALAIFLFHIILGISSSPVFHFWGGMFVAVFLILSGYGINESFHKHGLKGYWHKRLTKVVVPTLIFASCFSLFDPQRNLQTLVNEVLYVTPTYWFVFHVTKCYVVYWLARRFMARYWVVFMVLCAVVCLHYQVCDMHLESEQSFSFLLGVLLSEKKEWLQRLSPQRVRAALWGCFLIGLFAFGLKSLPTVHTYVGTVPYNYLLCPFRLTWGIVALFLLARFSLERSRMLAFCGRTSLEVYIAHIPLLPLITSISSVPTFVGFSLLSFALLYVYTTYVQPHLTLTMGLYLVVNALFVAKYSARLQPTLYPYLTFVALIIGFVLLRYALPWLMQCKRAYKPCLVMALIAVVGMLAVQYVVDPYSIQVDRWSALHFPIQNLLHGVYPYIASTHLGGNASPFPVWQLVHIPFYLLGNVGLSYFVALALFLWSVSSRWGKRAFLGAFVLLMAAPAVWYEVAVRSDFIANLLLVATFINWLSSRITTEWLTRHAVALAFIVGLFASTRLVTLIPLGLLLLPYYFSAPLRVKVMMPIVFGVVFVLTFAPFALWDWQDFFYHRNNPWSLQTRQGNTSDFFIFLPLALYLSLSWRGNWQRYYAYVALMLFLFVSITFVHNMFLHDNFNLFSPTFDITYYNSLLPFVIVGMIEVKKPCVKD